MGTASIEWLEAHWRSGEVSPEIWLRHEGGSMAPALLEGDRLLVTTLTGAPSLRPGEIVLFRSRNRLVAHRLLKLEGEIAITRGDASSRDDSPLLLEELLGRVTRVERCRIPFCRLRFWRSYPRRIRRRR